MDIATLLARLNDPEDQFTERKSAGVKASEIRRTACAFANSLPASSSGVLFVGLDDQSGAVNGVINTDQLQKRVNDALRDCYPLIAGVQQAVLQVNGGHVLAVVVPASDNRPHFTGPAYVRRGSESVNASVELFQELIDSRHSKVKAILHLRGGPAITVHCLGRKLIDPRPLEARYIEEHVAEVRACDTHEVIIYSNSCFHLVAVPLDSVRVGTDIKHGRPMITVIA